MALVRLDDGRPGLVTGGADRMLRLWCVSSRRCLRTISKRPAEAAAIVAAWGGRTALAGDRSGSLLAWDLGATKAPRLAAASRQGVAVACLAAGPCPASSSLVSVGWADGAVSIVDWLRDEVLARLWPHHGDVHSVRWARYPLATEAPTTVAMIPDASDCSAAIAASLVNTEPQPALAATEVSAEESIAVEECAAAQATAAAAADSEIQQHMEHGQQKPGHPVLQQAHQQPGVLMLVSSGSDCSMHVHALVVTAAPVPPAAAGDPVSSGANGAPGSSALTLSAAHVCSLHLPKPQSGLTQAQQTRIWFTAAWVPWPAGGDEPRTHAWLLSSGYGGSILAWQVPLPAFGACGAGTQGRVPPPPVRLPILHGRPVFTIHAALLGAGGRTPELTLLTTSMDRTVKQWALPLPPLAPSAESSGADSRATAAGSWGDSKEAAAAWKGAKPVWSVCGLGGFAYSLSLQLGAAAVVADGDGEAGDADSALLAVACGDRTVRLLPLVGGVAQHAQQAMLWGGLAGTAGVIAWLPAGLGGALPQQSLLAFGCKDGSVGLMMTQRNQSVLMPVKHKVGEAAGRQRICPHPPLLCRCHQRCNFFPTRHTLLFFATGHSAGAPLGGGIRQQLCAALEPLC